MNQSRASSLDGPEAFFTIFQNLETFYLYKFDSRPPNNPPPEQRVSITRFVFRLLTPNVLRLLSLLWRGERQT